VHAPLHGIQSRPPSAWPLLDVGIVANRKQKEQPTRTDDTASSLREVTAKNVASVLRLEAAEHARRSFADRAADAITAFCGSMNFIWTHVVWFGAWIGFNLVRPRGFDPFPFSLLTLVVSLEAIFLSTFILMSENRQARLDERRNHLDLQVNLLAEQENTKMLTMLRRIAERVGVAPDDDVHALEQTTDYEKLTDEIDRQQAAAECEAQETTPKPRP
jgi:uncharacterized membrane protein